jgi:hypothetical protein
MNEPMHRFKYTKLTKEQIVQKLKSTADGPKCASELSDVLAGKSLKIVTDNGPVLNYAFKDKRKLTLAEGNGSPVESGYPWNRERLQCLHRSGYESCHGF